MQSRAYHLVPVAWYALQPADAAYLPEPFAVDGFVHLTHTLEDVIAVGNMFYRCVVGDFLLLEIELTRLTSEVRYDDDSGKYPHVYGPLDRGAILAVHGVERDGDGAFVGLLP